MATRGYYKNSTFQIVPVKNSKKQKILFWSGSGGQVYSKDLLFEDDSFVEDVLRNSTENPGGWLGWLDVWGHDFEEDESNDRSTK